MLINNKFWLLVWLIWALPLLGSKGFLLAGWKPLLNILGLSFSLASGMLWDVCFCALISYFFSSFFIKYNLLSNWFPYNTQCSPQQVPSSMSITHFPLSPTPLSLFSVSTSLLWFASLPFCNFFSLPLPHGLQFRVLTIVQKES